MIGKFQRELTRAFVCACAAALVLAVAGCGGDDEEPASTAPATTATPTATVEEPTESEPAPTETEPAPAVTETAPEDMQGGAGDEEPARTLALFTATDGQVRPRVVRVPAFISIQVELRSADGREYGLRFGDVTVRAGGELSSTAKTIDGLRPGEAIAGVPTGAGNRVRIEATAEPGP